jgi:excisionase family DNA binding protein
MSPKLCSTGDAAKAVGISRATLQDWIAKGKITAPAVKVLGKVRVRLWSESDVAKLRREKAKLYVKGPGRSKKK